MISPHIELVDREMAAILAGKSEAERLRIAWGMWRSARKMLTCLVLAEHEDWSDVRIEGEVSRRMASGGVEGTASAQRAALRAWRLNGVVVE